MCVDCLVGDLAGVVAGASMELLGGIAVGAVVGWCARPWLARELRGGVGVGGAVRLLVFMHC